MMADFVVPRHSAVMDRLRRRIELFRRHHTSCESRYDNTARERLELDQQQTFALHQRCLQTKAKRSSKHRQPPPASDQTGLRATGTGGSTSDPADSAAAESRNNTRLALQESVKRKLESSGSPLSREQVNGFRDGYPPSKKASLEDGVLGGVNGTANGGLPPLSPRDTKHGVGLDSLVPNGTRSQGGDHNGAGLPDPGTARGQDSDPRLKEMKQEPVEDILPCMLPSGGGMGNSSLFPDLNLDEQEWKELMEELSGSVPYEDMQDIFNDGFEDRKDPELAGGGLPGPLPADPVNIKAEFSPAPPVFEQEPPSSSPQVRPIPGPPLACGSPAAAASSPAVGPSQAPRLPQGLLLPASSPKDLSPAQQLQQLAAREQQRAQLMQTQSQMTQPQLAQPQLTQKQLVQSQLTQAQLAQAQLQKQQQQQQQQQQAAKFHASNAQSSWSQATPSQSPLGGAYSLEKPSSPALYQQDFPNAKQLLMPAPPNKGSPKAGAGPYMQPGAHPNMLSHPPPNTLSQNAAGGQPSMLDYANTKPLSHYDGAQGPQGPSSAQSKAALLSLIRQQPMKQKAGLPFRPHLPHAQQEQNAYPAGAHIPGPPATMATQPPGNAMAGNHGNAAYMSSQAAALKQQQQMQFLMGQRQQILAEQEKQRQQQEQQLQRHLTRPPPQYQDQQNSQHAFQQQQQQQQQQVNQFTGSSQSLGAVGLPCGSAPGGQRMFPQAQSMMGMGVGQSGGPGGVAPPAASQADMAPYSSMSLHPHAAQTQRAPGNAMPVAYRQNQNLLAQQQQHHKSQPNAALLKQQQQLARMPNAMPGSLPNALSNALPNALPGGVPMQPQAWQQQHPGMQQAMTTQAAAGNGGLQVFGNPSFHAQSRLPKLPGSTPFSQAGLNSGRPLGAMNSAQMMAALPQQRTNPTLAPQQHPQSLAPPPQQQGQPLAPPPQQQSQQVMSSVNLPDLGAFSQAQSSQMTNRTSLQCNQGYPVNRTANPELSFSYNAQSGNGLPSFPGENDLMETLLKNQTTQDWMDDLDELLANHQ
ncbi:mastermind-like protein 1 isoform X1 [Anguilla rostrata]|uniref:mastermind-like protein 1 isoform X1 n=2 Tax=Anguilla rostrata TaxID=7938 RepID=UPI0030CDB75A